MHTPVLPEKAVKLWTSLDKYKTVKDGIYIDATFGWGGHSDYLLEYSKERNNVILVGIDWDPHKIKLAKEKYKNSLKENKLNLFINNFSTLENLVGSFRDQKQKKLPILGVLFDFGVCTNHFKEGRGFSFQEKNSPLDMRFNTEENPLTASEILNRWPERELEKLLREKGEERYGWKVARAVIGERKKGKRFIIVDDLLEILKKNLAFQYRKQSIHFATRVFQALRIAVNKEDENIEKGLAGALKILDRGGRIVTISFHSGEDRIVKNFFRRESQNCICKPNLPVCSCNHQKSLQIITKKPLVPENEEIKNNPNSRSAKLRAAEKI